MTESHCPAGARPLASGTPQGVQPQGYPPPRTGNTCSARWPGWTWSGPRPLCRWERSDRHAHFPAAYRACRAKRAWWGGPRFPRTTGGRGRCGNSPLGAWGRTYSRGCPLRPLPGGSGGVWTPLGGRHSVCSSSLCHTETRKESLPCTGQRWLQDAWRKRQGTSYLLEWNNPLFIGYTPCCASSN